jgi:8-oxo-dGTP pyrophosphatase MutT (NUDIX family)
VTAKKISVAEAKKDKLFYVVADTMVYRREDGRCLILKRDEREKVHPGKWATVGGKLEHEDLNLNKPSRKEGDVLVFEDSIYKLIAREAQEEAGVSIKLSPRFVGTKTIVRPDGIPVVILHFVAEYEDGEVKPEPGGFTEYAWVNSEEVKNYDCIEDIAEGVKTVIKIFKDEN